MGHCMSFLLVFSLNVVLFLGTYGQHCTSLTTQCDCDEGQSGGFELHCPNIFNIEFTIKYYEDESAEIVCGHDRQVDYSLFKQVHLDTVTFVKFKFCPLPDFPLSHLVNDLQLGEVRSLTFKSYKNLSDSLQNFHLSGLTHLSHLGLGENKLTQLPNNLLESFPNLTSIIINDNDLHLPPDLFKHTPNLLAVQLGRNNLQVLPPSLFKRTNFLRILNLENNDLTEISNDTFTNLKHLEILDLHSNLLTTLPPGVFDNLHYLRELNLIYNQLTSISEYVVHNNTRLQVLKLFGNRHLSAIPPNTFSKSVALTQLYLQRCNLTTLHDTLFHSLRALRKLNLADNQLADIPEKLFYKSLNLQYIDLSNNLISELAEGTFANLRSLETLKLNGNRLKHISGHLFYDTTNLLKLHLQNNQLDNIEKDAFSQLTELQYLDASENYLDFKDAFQDPFTGEQKSPFHACIGLKTLNLHTNNLTRMYSDWPTSHIKLNELDLKYNNIGFISLRDIYFLSDNIQVDLRYNNISTINLWTSQSLVQNISPKTRSTSSDVRILLDNNPLTCNCLILDFINYVQSTDVNSRDNFELYTTDLRCVQPPKLKNTLVKDIAKSDLVCDITSGCPESCTCYFRAVDRGIIVDCSHLQLTTMPSTLPLNTSILYLEHNNLTSIDALSEPIFQNITELYLSYNKIGVINHTSLPPLLRRITLDHNNLMTWNKEEVEGIERRMNESKLMLSMGSNPWECSCDLLHLYHLLPVNYQQILDIEDIYCARLNKALIDLTAEKLCPATHIAIIVISTTLIIVISVLSVFAIIYYKNIHTIKIWLYAHNMGHCWITEEQLESDKKYDAFVSYSHKDEDFIMNELVCKLEGEEPYYKLCIHQRDWAPGEYIRNQIISSVDNSKRTIVVLSNNFTESMWSLEEFKIAHNKTLEDRQNRVIVILYGDVPSKDKTDPDLSMYLATNTYLKWGDPAFWEKLRYALPKVKKLKQIEKEKFCNSGTSLETISVKTTSTEL